MGRIKGHYEWDDDDLTPGQKKEGGLHQNLFDADGNLKGSARFVPDEDGDDEPLVITETVYVTLEERRRDRAAEELQEEISRLISIYIDRGIERAKPIVEQWWRESARPAIVARRERFRARRAARRQAREPIYVESTIVEDSTEVAEAEPEARPAMSKAEAEARYLAALAARAYSDEQMRLVSSAQIVEGGGPDELAQSLAELPAEEVRGLIEAMVTNPSMLGEETLADLASLLGQTPRPEEEEHRLTARRVDVATTSIDPAPLPPSREPD